MPFFVHGNIAAIFGFSMFDKVCDLIDEAATLSCQYWLEAEPRSGTIATRSTALIAMEAQIQGLQDRCVGYLDILCPRFDANGKDRVMVAASAFSEALTGGTFNSRKTQIDAQRAREVHSCASDLVFQCR